MPKAAALAISLLPWLLPGCSGLSSSSKAIEDGRTAIPYARQFHDLFPAAEASFSYFTGEMGPPTWTSKVGLHGRYVLTLKVEVTFNAARTRIVRYGEPVFHLVEVTRIVPAGPDHNAAILYGSQISFGRKEWSRLVERQGDLAVLGMAILKDRPVDGFEQYWHAA